MKDIFELERRTDIPKDSSYIRSYPSLLRFFNEIPSISAEDVVCGAHMVYGWMPTILTIYFDQEYIDPTLAAAILNKAREEGDLLDYEIEKLALLINHSFVGASKLLHFVAPESFAIWDSKVYSFVHEKQPHNSRVNKTSAYVDYLIKLNSLKKDLRFEKFYESVNTKVGYQVTPFRAMELIMYLNAHIFE